MRKILDKWWIFVCWGIAIFMVSMFIMIDLHVNIDGKSYMKKVGDNVHPMIENIKIHADGNEYEIVIIDGEFKNKRLDNKEFNLKARMYQGRAVINYYILKKGCEPLNEDYNLWCFYSIIPVKRDWIFSEYHIDGKAINEEIFYNWMYYFFIKNFVDGYLEHRDNEIYTGWETHNLKIEDNKSENNIVFTEKGEVEGELLLSYIAIDKEEKIKVTARLVVENLKGDKDLYITTERI